MGSDICLMLDNEHGILRAICGDFLLWAPSGFKGIYENGAPFTAITHRFSEVWLWPDHCFYFVGTRQGMQIWSHDGVLQSSAGEQDGFGQAWDVAWNADSKYLAYSPSLNTTCIWHVEEKRIMWSHVFEDDDISCEKRSIHCWKDHSTILIYVVVDKYHRRETRPLNQFYQVDITSPSDQSWQAVPFLTLDPKDVISKYIYRRTGFEVSSVFPQHHTDFSFFLRTDTYRHTHTGRHTHTLTYTYPDKHRHIQWHTETNRDRQRRTFKHKFVGCERAKIRVVRDW